MAEAVTKGKPSVLGFCSGAVAGLVVITPACGFVNSTGAMVIGFFAGLIPFLAVTYLKPALGYDDALDTFGVHAVGGTLGAFLTGVLATSEVNANLVSDAVAGKNGLKALVESHTVWKAQLGAIGVTLVLAIVATTIIAFIVKAVVGLRPSPDGESQGLDLADHGEEGYILS
jgi:ammonium transporter, Amt family